MGLLFSCQPNAPTVFVPAPAYTQTVEVRTDQGITATIAVGEPLLLYATLRAGPWTEVPRDVGTKGDCWLESEPPELAENVANGVQWLVDPPGNARFNIEFRNDGSRDVSFKAPGQYELVALSAFWCAPKYESNRIVVSVTE